jgi:hypothetical protein
MMGAIQDPCYLLTGLTGSLAVPSDRLGQHNAQSFPTVVAWESLITFGAYAMIVDHRSLPIFRVEW